MRREWMRHSETQTFRNPFARRVREYRRVAESEQDRSHDSSQDDDEGATMTSRQLVAVSTRN